MSCKPELLVGFQPSPIAILSPDRLPHDGQDCSADPRPLHCPLAVPMNDIASLEFVNEIIEVRILL